MYPIITISREVGSNGHTIAEMVAKELDIQLLDKSFLSEVAKATGADLDKIESKGEYFSQFNFFMSAKFYNGLYLGDEQTDIFDIQKKIILDEAKKGPCVIVGRCADAILEKAGIPSLNVFVHADMAYRLQECHDRYPDVPTEDLEKLIKKKDKGRRAYYRFYTDKEWGEIGNYDLSLDSCKLGLELCVKLIVEAAKALA